MSVPSDLADARRVAERFGIERTTAERIMRTLTVYRVPGVRRAYVSRSSASRLVRNDPRCTCLLYRDRCHLTNHRGSPARVARLTTYTLILTLLPS